MQLPVCGDLKVYLSSIKDFYNGSVVSHSCSTSTTSRLIIAILAKALDANKFLEGLVLHFDQGFQYQHAMWCNRFESRRITKSMSRKGNCLDNSKVETSFAT
ncbi:DDE-type integrase/transposase/recombinase [uncultured Sphaerochaeta sp.]|uniref:DDE-type integrase/transposase/recombinase n=1 Tax=uncultured Sphaerochaeta sp. TaxID=886478 RepID=UPI003749AA27